MSTVAPATAAFDIDREVARLDERRDSRRAEERRIRESRDQARAEERRADDRRAEGRGGNVDSYA